MRDLSIASLVLLFAAALSVKVCPSGWMFFSNSCYFLVKNSVNWFDAREICRMYGSSLTEINSKNENNYLKNVIKFLKINEVWIGLDDLERKGTYRWSASKGLPTFTRWLQGSPPHPVTGHDCVEIIFFHREGWRGSWRDKNCTDLLPAFCEAEPFDVEPEPEVDDMSPNTESLPDSNLENGAVDMIQNTGSSDASFDLEPATELQDIPPNTSSDIFSDLEPETDDMSPATQPPDLDLKTVAIAVNDAANTQPSNMSRWLPPDEQPSDRSVDMYTDDMPPSTQPSGSKVDVNTDDMPPSTQPSGSKVDFNTDDMPPSTQPSGSKVDVNTDDMPPSTQPSGSKVDVDPEYGSDYAPADTRLPGSDLTTKPENDPVT
ncbi:uncharacterized protein LOC112565285 isoform X2 [Pomacea canaliculata]|uniref:uncharacterized protein LOC112565285 isoform X2 n=1 Tax=Pomacea canaliculata TaxID=400727 RepID=UPI000D72AF94|nr:uncharacterized protein LOC112565285 isoform X2 [Pomacea canaliculata]